MNKPRIKRVKKDLSKTPLVFPAFLPGRRGSANWHIKETTGVPMTLNQAGEWIVPFGNEEKDKFARAHEAMHAAHSPLDEPKDILGPGGVIFTSVDSLLLAEELRIDTFLRHKIREENLPQVYAEENDQVMERLKGLYALSGDISHAKDALSFLLSTLGSEPRPQKNWKRFYTEAPMYLTTEEQRGRWKSLDNFFAKTIIKIVNEWWSIELYALSQGRMVPWERVIELGNRYDRLFQVLEDSNAMLPPEPLDDDLEGLAEQSGKYNPNEEFDPLAEAFKGEFEPVNNRSFNVQWGEVEWTYPPRKDRLPGKKTTKQKWRAMEEGVSPRNIHRMTVDGQIFGRRRKVPGGSVMIDDSGSMDWSDEDIEDIIQSAPGVVVAAYSAQMPRDGEIMLIAKDGKYAAGSRPKGNGNYIDMPAIEWLATQPEPRIWVTDGYVVPVGGYNEQAATECIEFAIANKINVVRTGAEAAEVFQGKRAIYR